MTARPMSAAVYHARLRLLVLRLTAAVGAAKRAYAAHLDAMTRQFIRQQDAPKPAQLTIRDVHADPHKLADYLGIEPFGQMVEERSRYYGRHRGNVSVSHPESAPEFTARVNAAWREYRTANNTRRTQGYAAFIRECARAVLKTTKGTLAEVRAACVAKRPDLYNVTEASAAA